VTVTAPADHAQLPRFPPPDLEWEPVVPPPAAYALERQYSQPGREFWSHSTIEIVSPSPAGISLWMKMQTVIGQQPHRWRIWAIGRNGTVSTSGWRAVDYTN
jgi:hypothetical protein